MVMWDLDGKVLDVCQKCAWNASGGLSVSWQGEGLGKWQSWPKMTSSVCGCSSWGGEGSREEFGEESVQGWGKWSRKWGVKSRTFLMIWLVVGEAGCPIPSSQRTFSSSVTFSPRGPQSSTCVDWLSSAYFSEINEFWPLELCKVASLAIVSAWPQPISVSQAPGLGVG